MKNKKNVIIISMVAMIAVMIVGYAAFSASLKINGLANIESNWNILFTNIEIVEKTSGATETLLPEATGTSATFSVNLKLPGDYIEYEITVENRGTLGAIVGSINASETGNDAFTFEITNIAKGDRLAKESSTTFNVKVTFDEDATSVPVDHNKLTLEIMYVQDVGQSVGSEDIIITGSTLTTLSGNTTLSLANSAGRKLANYTISGNSVQNGTPTPDAPVEIQSVGNKTVNLFDGVFKVGGINGSTGVAYDTSSTIITANYISIKPNTTYTFSRTFSGNIRFRFYDSDKNYIGYLINAVSASNYTFTTVENAYYLRFDIVNKDVNVKLQLQEGTTATEYEPYGKYKIPIEVSGKNLINKENSEEGYSINSSGNKTANGSLAVTEKIYVKPSTTYVYSGMGNVTGTTVMRTGYQYDAAGNPINAISSSNGTAIKFTTEANCAYVLLQYVKTEEKPMLEEGTAATEYEPYVEPTTYNIYLDEPLRCISGVCDTIDFKTKTLTRNVKEIILTGNENWVLYNTNSIYQMYTNNLTLGGKTGTGCLSGFAPEGVTANNRHEHSLGVYLVTSGNQVAVQLLGYSTTMSVDEWKEYLKANNIKVNYQLATPITKDIDLPTIQTAEGTSIISIKSDNGVSVPISVEYYKMD